MKYIYFPKRAGYEKWEIYLLEHLHSAINHALRGGTSLVLHKVWFKSLLKSQRREIENGYPIANIYSQDVEMLCYTATRFGGNKEIYYPDTKYQHVEMYGHSLRGLMSDLGDDLDHYQEMVLLAKEKR